VNDWVLITGGTGTIGSALAESYLARKMRVRILSRDETAQQELRLRFERMYHNHGWPKFDMYRFFLGDVRDSARLLRAMENVAIVYHAAALKHVDACEYNPSEAIATNVGGVQNVINSAIASGVKAVVNMSSDKAVEPCNLLGATKLVSERLMAQANSHGRGCRFMSVRFGNVLGSRGSVLRLWDRQMHERGEIEITDPEATRFVMSVKQAVELCIIASDGVGGETFVHDMPAVRMRELADAVISRFEREHDVHGTVKTKLIGLRPGETLDESVISQHEAARTYRFAGVYAILPNVLFTHLDYNAVYGKLPKLDRVVNSAQRWQEAPCNPEYVRRLLREWEV